MSVYSAPPEQKYIAEVLNDDGTIYDYAYNWETAQNYALSEGRQIRALCADGHMSRNDIQALCDAERERYRDCFGITD